MRWGSTRNRAKRLANRKAGQLLKGDPGERAIRFLGNLTHTGDYAGEPFNLRPWQADPVRRLFGTLRPDGTRQYRKLFMALPRKQGKTEIVAGLGLYLLLGQGRSNQRIYTASGDVEQAALIFGAACEMIRNDPVLSEITQIYDGYKRIDYPAGRSSLKVLSRTPHSKHGLGPTAVLFDEYHVIDEALVNVLTTGFAARKDPLQVMITTAGHDRESLCYDEWQYAEKVKRGEITDPTYLPVIFSADPDDDWRNEATWRKAMPALGDFCSLDFIREECKKATERPRFENTFRQLYLNQWTEAAERWLSAEKWADCSGSFDPADFVGVPCVGGLDLGVTGDMSAVARVWVRENVACVQVRFYAPEQGKWRKEPKNADLYKRWEKSGHLTFTPGDTTDHQQIENDIVAWHKESPFALLLADRAYGSHILNRLYNIHEVPVRGIPQGPVTLNEPMVRFEELVIKGRIAHNANPVLTWNVANANVKRNSTGLMHLDKASATLRIDGLAAVINAIRGLIDTDGLDSASVYTARGLTVL
jgi:phage terminase large subunit-like protein